MLIFLSILDSEEERELLESLYLEHRSAMFALARKYLENDYDAEDVVQTVFLEAAQKHMNALKARADDARKRFLMLAVKYRSIDLLRKRGNTLPLEDETLAYFGADIPDDELVETVCRNVAAEQLKKAVASLDPKFKEALWLKLSYDLTAAEIAELLGEKTSTIEKRLLNGKKKLKAVLGPEGGAA